MKRIILTIFAAFLLSACGGGGGGAAPSVNSGDSRVGLTPAEQAEVQRLNSLRSEVDALGSSNQAEKDLLLDEIDSLLAKINAQSETIDNLRNEIATLQDRIVKVAVSPPVEISPPPTCNGANEEANGGSCVCVADYSRKNGVCEKDVPPTTTCNGANEEANGGNCVCVAGYSRKNGVCEKDVPTTTTCNGANEEANGRNCECVSGYVRKDGVCVKSAYNTPEYQRNRGLSLANVIPAYEMGIFGQGVTVIIEDFGFRHTHEELLPNLITATTTLSSQDFRWRAGIRDRGEGQAHGTAVASILGGIFGNAESSHGVAPSVTMIPIHQSGKAPRQYIDFALERDIAIVSRSIGSASDLVFANAEEAMAMAPDLITTYAGRLKAQIGDGDFVLVNGAGNNGRHSVVISPDPFLSVPLFEPDLADNILVVVNIDANERIGRRSNGCGWARDWCISAFGGDMTTAATFTDDDYRGDFSETSAATPVVAGALALLKSYRPQVSVTMLLQVLLESARPLGTRKDDGMPDEVLGWGAVDVGNGIATLMVMKTENGILYDDLRESLPGEFAHLRGRLSDVSVALRITDRSYYNMRLSDIVGGGGESAAANIGGAAKEMQADSYKAGESFRFWGGLDYDGGKSNYIGEGGGIFSAAAAEDIGGYMRWTTANYGGISAFGEYGRTEINADYGGNKMIAAVDNARAEEWTMGIQYRDLWRKDDNIILSARQESRISGGNMILRYPVADGDSHKAFIGETPQTIRTETTRIPIKQKPQTIWTLGYSQQTDNGKWSAATEWNTAKNESAFSFAIELQIR